MGTDYSMTSGFGRTHRYLDTHAAPTLFPFAWGMSYADITSNIYLDQDTVEFGRNFTVKISLRSDQPALHVIALFASCEGGGQGGAPKQSLIGIDKVPLKPGEEHHA